VSATRNQAWRLIVHCFFFARKKTQGLRVRARVEKENKPLAGSRKKTSDLVVRRWGGILVISELFFGKKVSWGGARAQAILPHNEKRVVWGTQTFSGIGVVVKERVREEARLSTVPLSL
jgi:hypothetical protein